MAEVAPTILTADPEVYRTTIESFNHFAKRVQIDIADGDFVEAKTIPTIQVWWPRGWTTDLHMMVARPSQHLPALLKMHPSLAIFHVECGENLLPVIKQLQAYKIKAGIAFGKASYPGNFKEYILAADHALIFAGNLGHQGGEADLMQIEKATIIRNIKKDIEIGWDGGVNLENIRTIAHAGVDVVNVGSAITDAKDRPAMYQALVVEADKRGVRL